jgi:DNA polymerase-3 subunit alpha
MSFVHLHVHDIYSFGEGIGSPDEFIDQAKKMEQTAIAQTNNGNICGSYNWWKACKDKGLKAILGQEFHMAVSDNMKARDADKTRRLVVLARNQEGWKNLCRLSSISYRDGFYYKPRIDTKVLLEYSKGLIALAGGMNGVIGTYWAMREERQALAAAQMYKTLLKGRFYLEVQPTYEQRQMDFNQFVVKLSEREQIPIVATNNCYYVMPEMAKYHPYLVMVKNNMKVEEFERKNTIPDSLYLMARSEMEEGFLRQGFGEELVNDWLDNTGRIAERVEEITFETSFKLPKFSDFEDVTPEEMDNESKSKSPSLFD